MIRLKLQYHNKELRINNKENYHIGEILTTCLNTINSKINIKNLEKLHRDLGYYKQQLILETNLPSDFIYQYDNKVYKAQSTISTINSIAKKILPYSRFFYPKGGELIKLLNEFIVWEEPDEYSNLEPDRYGFIGKDEIGNHHFELTKFVPDISNRSFQVHEMEKANIEMANFFDKYICFLEDVLRVHYVYSDLVDNYIHTDNRFSDDSEVAKIIMQYQNKNKVKVYLYDKLLSCRNLELEFTPMITDTKEPTLAETYTINNFGTLLYLEFFQGLKVGSIPRRCENCGTYFLINNGRYSEFCENPLKDDKTKTCRDIGSRKKYDDKCKTDPVWLTYNRAYKAHYARYMKKKMTISEFEKWSAYAIELREQMLNNELDFEEYQKMIKK